MSKGKEALKSKEVILTMDGKKIDVWCNFDELVEPEKLIPNPRNPNTHTEEQINRLAIIIRFQGWRNKIVVSNQSGFIVKGHARLQAAMLLGCKAPIEYQDYENDASEWADMIADNKIAELATTNFGMLTNVMLELDEINFNMDLTGFEQREIENIMLYTGKPNDPDENYTGMPEYGQDDMTHRQISVSFETEQAVQHFAKLVQQKITPKTKYIWYPKAEREKYVDGGYVDGDEA